MSLKTKFIFKPIGIIHSPYKEPSGTPIQTIYSNNAIATVEIFDEFTEGLDDIEKFSHIYLIYVFDRSHRFELKIKPFLDNKTHGVFTTRAPNRPNPIGLSIVRLINRKKNILTIKEIDIFDKTPLLDIKPFIPFWDNRMKVKTGWLTEKMKKTKKYFSDNRFK